MPHMPSIGELAFRLVSPLTTAPRSPGGKTVVGNEMKLSIAALGVDGFTKADARLLQSTFAEQKLTREAQKLLAEATKILDEVPTYKAGSYAALSGKVEYQQLFGIGGEAPPSGMYLMLDNPIKVDGAETKMIFLGEQGSGRYVEGAAVKLNGRLDIGSYGGVEVLDGKYVALSGVTNLSAGEPRFDGENFTNAAGKQLPVLSYSNHMIADVPANIFVLDQSSDKAFVGAMGGFIPEWLNPFHGLSGARAIESASAADQAKVKVSGSELFSVATGEALEPVGAEGRNQWFIDTDTRMLFRLANGAVDQVVRLEDSDIYG